MLSAELEKIRPIEKSLVIDVLKALNFNVDKWNGNPSHPQYCSEWIFEDGGRILISLWFSKMQEDALGLFQRHNFQQERDVYANRINELDDKKCKGNALKSARSEQAQCRNWIGKLDRLDSGLQRYKNSGARIRVMVCEGSYTDSDLPKAAVAKNRKLDDVEWHVESFDINTLEFILRRGLPTKAALYIDQFSAPLNEGSDAGNKKVVSGMVFERSAQVREDVLQRAKGRCEFCGAQGFTRADGAIYLESHHIIPLSEDGPDKIFNVAALCPNHHREAHYGQLRDQIRQTLSAKFSTP